MNWRDLSLKWKLALPLGAITGLLLVLSVQQISMMQSSSNKFKSIYDNYVPAIDLTLNADRDLYQAQIAERTMAMGGLSPDNLTSYHENIQQVDDRLNKVLTLDIEDNIKSDVNAFLTALNQWRSNSNAMVSQLESKSISTTQATTLSEGSLAQEFESIREILDNIGEDLSATAGQYAIELEENSESSIAASIIFTGILMLICAAIVHFFPKLIVQNIKLLQSALDEIANGKGDLRQRLPDIGHDEVGNVCHTFNRFLDSLQTLIQQVGNTTVEVNQYSDDMVATVGENTESVNELTASIQLVSTAINEMESAILEVSQNTQGVSNETLRADEESKKAAGIFQNTISEITGLTERVDHSVSDIQQLESEAQGIASVLDVIRGIAEQTNLLALNAAIEAARAGEQGRGFAVVADEVRSLASKTAESTADINQMILRLQQGVNNVVSSMDAVRSKASDTVNSAHLAESSLNEVNHNLGSMNSRILQVAAAIEEQSSVVESINGQISNINDLSESLGVKAVTVASVCMDLKKESNQLRNQVSNFTV